MSREARHPWQHLMGLAAAGAVVVLVPLTLSPWFGWVYPLELLCHFQLQYLIAAVVCALVLAGLRRLGWCLAAVGCALVAAAALVPFELGGGGSAAHATPPHTTLPLATSAHPTSAHATSPRATPGRGDGPSLRLLLANVLARNDEHERALAMVEAADADVLVFQEVNDRWMTALETLQRDYPHTLAEARPDAFGVVVFSRVPLDEAACVALGAAARPTAVLRLALDGTPVTVVATHPMHPLTPRTFARRNDQLDAVAAYVADRTQPLVLIGDLNVTMWSPWYRRFRAEARLTDTRHGFGVRPSWPTFLPAFMRLPIDHCLVSEELAVTDCRLGPAFGSDHRPLIVDVALR